MESKKKGLVAALVAKTEALLQLLDLCNNLDAATDTTMTTTAIPTSEEDKKTPLKNEIEQGCKEIAKWENLTSDDYWSLFVRRQILSQRYGLALKRISDLLSASMDNKGDHKVKPLCIHVTDHNIFPASFFPLFPSVLFFLPSMICSITSLLPLIF